MLEDNRFVYDDEHARQTEEGVSIFGEGDWEGRLESNEVINAGEAFLVTFKLTGDFECEMDLMVTEGTSMGLYIYPEFINPSLWDDNTAYSGDEYMDIDTLGNVVQGREYYLFGAMGTHSLMIVLMEKGDPSSYALYETDFFEGWDEYDWRFFVNINRGSVELLSYEKYKIDLQIPSEITGLTAYEYTSPPVGLPDPLPADSLPPRIVFSTQVNDVIRNIRVMNPDGSWLTNLTPLEAWSISPAWLPDGDTIAFISDRDGAYEIYLMDKNGDNQTRLTNNDLSEVSQIWSPDGSKILVRGYYGADAAWDANHELFIMDSDGSDIVQLTDNNYPDSIENASFGSDYVLVSMEVGENDYDVFMMDYEGNVVAQFEDDGLSPFHPRFSPDGSKILYNPYGGDLYVLDVESGNHTQLTFDESIEAPAGWSSDGSQIVFSSSRAGHDSEIFIMNADGTDIIQLTDNDWDDREPIWSP